MTQRRWILTPKGFDRLNELFRNVEYNVDKPAGNLGKIEQNILIGIEGMGILLRPGISKDWNQWKRIATRLVESGLIVEEGTVDNLYHVTPEKNVSSIQKEGLRPGKMGSSTEIGSRVHKETTKSVFLISGNGLSDVIGLWESGDEVPEWKGKAAIFRVDVPESTSLKTDYALPGGSVMSKRHIPPDKLELIGIRGADEWTDWIESTEGVN